MYSRQNLLLLVVVVSAVATILVGLRTGILTYSVPYCTFSVKDDQSLVIASPTRQHGSEADLLLRRFTSDVYFKHESDVKSESYNTSVQVVQTPKTEQLFGREHFHTRRSFHLPLPANTRAIEEILKSKWVRCLQTYLWSNHMHTSGPLVLISSDAAYKELLLNWLITAVVRANVALGSILVLSISPVLHELLQSKDIPSVYIPPESVLNPIVPLEDYSTPEQIKIIRLTVMRLVNHWGVDVALYDTDAILLKNPNPLFQHTTADIISAYGTFPQSLYRKWGVTVCIGMLLLRSSLWTGIYYAKERVTYLAIQQLCV